MIAHDPLSLAFIFCFLLGFGFFIASALLGGHGHTHGAGHAAGHAHVASHTIGHTHGAAHTAGHAHTATHTSNAQSTSEQARLHPPLHAHGNHQVAGGHGRFALFTFLNPMSIALFLLGFGFFGYFFHNATDLAASLTLILATGSGLVIAALLLLALNRLFANSEGSTELDVVDRTGMIGKVSITIPEKGVGEIIYTSPGGVRKSIPARGFSSQRFERDQEVVVVNYQGGVAEVDTWENFIQERPDFTVPSALDEPGEFQQFRAETRPAEMEIVMHQEQQKE